MRKKSDFIYIFIVWALTLIGLYKAVKWTLSYAPWLLFVALGVLVLGFWWEIRGRQELGDDAQRRREEAAHWRAKWDKPIPPIIPNKHSQPDPVCSHQIEVWRDELKKDWAAVQTKSAARKGGKTIETIPH